MGPGPTAYRQQHVEQCGCLRREMIATLLAVDPVDYVDTFIAVADDSTATVGTVPPSKPDNPSVASRTFEMISEHPYRYTSGDVIFVVFADRRGIPGEERTAARREFYSRGQPCLRSSDLAKRYGWGIHADGAGRIALVGVETAEYAEFVSGRNPRSGGEPVKVTKAMRSSRVPR